MRDEINIGEDCCAVAALLPEGVVIPGVGAMPIVLPLLVVSALQLFPVRPSLVMNHGLPPHQTRFLFALSLLLVVYH